MIRFLGKLIKAYLNHNVVNCCYHTKFLVFFREPISVRERSKNLSFFPDVIRKVQFFSVGCFPAALLPSKLSGEMLYKQAWLFPSWKLCASEFPIFPLIRNSIPCVVSVGYILRENHFFSAKIQMKVSKETLNFLFFFF